jgi:TolA-binding protein
MKPLSELLGSSALTFGVSDIEALQWPAGLLLSSACMPVLSWVLTYRIFVSSQEHHAFKVYVSETYMRRDDLQQQLHTLHGHIATMQQQLQQMQLILHGWQAHRCHS